MADLLNDRSSKLYRASVVYNRYQWAATLVRVAEQVKWNRLEKVVDYYCHHEIHDKSGCLLIIMHPKRLLADTFKWIEDCIQREARAQGEVYDEMHPDMI